MARHKQVIIFDFDGTLVDSMGEFTDIAARVMHHYFDLPLSKGAALYKATSGLPFSEQVAVLFDKHPNTEAAVGAFESEKAVSYLAKPAFPDAHDTLIMLKQLSFSTVISSNNFQALVDRLVKHLLLPVDLALGLRSDFAKGEAHFNFISQTFNVTRDAMVFVGDSLKDAEHAQAADIDFIAKAGTFSAEEFAKYPRVPVIHQLRELPKLLTKLYPPS